MGIFHTKIPNLWFGPLGAEPEISDWKCENAHTAAKGGTISGALCQINSLSSLTSLEAINDTAVHFRNVVRFVL